MKEKTCCFAAQNRRIIFDEDNPGCIKLILKITLEIELMIKKGCNTFITGMDWRSELWFAEAVLDLKRAYPQKGINLIVVQYAGQASRWNKYYLDRYKRVLLHADDKVTLGADYYNGYMQQINQYMIRHSAHMIALFAGRKEPVIASDPDTVIINPNDFFVKKPRIFSIVK